MAHRMELSKTELLEIIVDLEKENAELSRQIKLFLDAENWGNDAVKYEGEYLG